jgi:glycosyltransferase involved in cell wall biosynthesis
MADSRLRVLFYIATLDSGGAERQVLQLVQRLDRRRFAPHLGIAVRAGPLLAEVPADVPLYACQEPGERHRRLGLNRYYRWKKIAQILRRERIDVVYDRTFQATLDAGPATWLRPTPRISFVTADPAIQMDLYFPRRQWLWRQLSQRIYRTADLVLANSEDLRQRVIEYFRLSPDRVRLATNLLDSERIDVLATSQLAARPGRFTILTVGRIDEHKGHRDLLHALRVVVHEQGRREVLWQIIGDGPSRESLANEVQSLGLQDHIEWLGTVANPYPYYRTAGCFCLPSLTEGSPNVLLEALALGTPVIATDCPSGPREILEEGRWGELVPVRSPPALAAAIAAHAANPESWRPRAQAAQSIIRERYAAEAGVRQLEALFAAVARRKPVCDTP